MKQPLISTPLSPAQLRLINLHNSYLPSIRANEIIKKLSRQVVIGRFTFTLKPLKTFTSSGWNTLTELLVCLEKKECITSVHIPEILAPKKTLSHHSAAHVAKVKMHDNPDSFGDDP